MNGTGSKYEVLNEIKQMISASDFLSVLSYYGIKIVKNSILCPVHNDTHYGSCVISKNGKKANCYACGETIDSIKIVMIKEGLEFQDAVEFLWCNILGRTLPSYEKNSKKFVFSYKDLQYIGLLNAGGKSVMMYLNVAEKKALLPSGYVHDYHSCDINGMYAVGIQMFAPSIYKLYEENPEAALFIIKGKTREKINYYNDLQKELRNKNTPIGEAACNDEKYLLETSALLQENIRYLKKFLRKIDGVSYQVRTAAKKAH